MKEEEIVEVLEELGISNKNKWTMIAKESNSAILAKLRFLRPLQKELNKYLYDYDMWIENYIGNSELKNIINKLKEAGISNKIIGQFTYIITLNAYRDVLFRLEDPAGLDYDLKNEGNSLPSWVLKEILKKKDGNNVVTEESERHLHGLFDMLPLDDFKKT